jgi:hypothetical protein
MYLLQARILPPNRVEYISLSDEEAEELCGNEFMEKLTSRREATDANNAFRVEVSVGQGKGLVERG